MALTLWTTAGFVVFIVLWSLAVKPIDAIMLTLLFIIIGATIDVLKRYLPNKRQ